jgi:hypothetical protein
MLKDILAGIFWALLTSFLFGVPFTFGWAALGVLFALLPDIDFVVEYLARGTVGGKRLGAHRVLTHTPLLFVPVGFALFFWLGAAVAALFALGVIGHFLHDARGMGYGYRLFYPFDRHFYKFFSDREGRFSSAPENFVQRFSREEVERLHQEHGNDRWLQDDFAYHLAHWPGLLLKVLLFSLILVALSLLVKTL